MRGDKQQRRVDWRVIGSLMVSLVVSTTAREHGASFWMSLVVAAAVAGVLTVIIEQTATLNEVTGR
jgi:hypothetical protein